MKSNATKFRNQFLFSLVSVALTLASFVNTPAETVTKTFEIGEGTSQLHSHVRTFTLPCGFPVSATVKFQRLGPDSSASDFPIKIELRKPDIGPDQEGPIAETENAFAKRAQQSVSVASPAVNRGCSRPWRVRVRYANDGAAPFTVYGNIAFNFTLGSARTMGVAGGNFDLSKGNSAVTKDLGGSGGFLQGNIVIVGTWVHKVQGLYPIPGPFPVRLRYELINPAGEIVASDSGYSNSETNTCCSSDRMRIAFRVAECTTGQWKIRVTNISSLNDAGNIETKATFTPDCP